MTHLTSQEEILLLAVWTLGDEAYGVPIRRYVSKATGRNWSIGAVYDPLYRMERKGLIRSGLSEPTGERGGRSRRMFTVTEKGKKMLLAHRNMRDTLWNALPGTLPGPVV